MNADEDVRKAHMGRHMFVRGLMFEDTGVNQTEFHMPPASRPPPPRLPLPTSATPIKGSGDVNMPIHIHKTFSGIGTLKTPPNRYRRTEEMRESSPGDWSPRPGKSQRNYKRKLSSYLRKHNLTHLNSQKLLRQFQGHEDDIFRFLEGKYEDTCESLVEDTEELHSFAKEKDGSVTEKKTPRPSPDEVAISVSGLGELMSTPNHYRRIDDMRDNSPGGWSPRPVGSQRKYKARLRSFLRHHGLTHLSSQRLLQEFQGHEEELFRCLEEKYAGAPSSSVSESERCLSDLTEIKLAS